MLPHACLPVGCDVVVVRLDLEPPRLDHQLLHTPPRLATADKSGNIKVCRWVFVSISPARLHVRCTKPHGAYVQVSGRNRVDPPLAEIERLAVRTRPRLESTARIVAVKSPTVSGTWLGCTMWVASQGGCRIVAVASPGVTTGHTMWAGGGRVGIVAPHQPRGPAAGVAKRLAPDQGSTAPNRLVVLRAGLATKAARAHSLSATPLARRCYVRRGPRRP